MPSAILEQNERRRAIARLLAEHVVNRQAELVELLRAEGYLATQSSVSRDLRDLGAAKLKNGYSLPKPAEIGDEESLLGRRGIRARHPLGRTELARHHHGHRRGAARRGDARSHRLARDRRHGLGRRHDLRGDDRRQRTTPATRPVTTTSEEGTDMTSASQSHRSRVLGRSRHVVLRAVAQGDLQPPRGDGDRQLRRHRRGRGARARRARPCARRGRPSPHRGAAGVLRQGHQVPDHGQRAPRQHVSVVRRRRARLAGEVLGAAREGARLRHRRARLHRGRQRPSAVRDRAEGRRARAHDLGARARPRVAAARAGQVPRGAQDARADARLGVLDESRPLGRHDRRHRDARLEGQHSGVGLGALGRRARQAAAVRGDRDRVRAGRARRRSTASGSTPSP